MPDDSGEGSHLLTRRSVVLGTASVTALASQLTPHLTPRQALAQTPQLRIIVPFSAGSGTVMLTTSGHTTNAVLMKKLPYDSIEDFTPVTLLQRSSGFALLVGDKSPFRTIDPFIAAAKAQPGNLTFGSSGVDNTTHVMGVFFCKGTDLDMIHVPFKGTPINELIGGVVDCAFLSPGVAGAAIRAGELGGLGISGTKRSTLLPDMPTFTEQGLKVQDIPAWSGIFAPPKVTGRQYARKATPLAAAHALTRSLLGSPRIAWTSLRRAWSLHNTGTKPLVLMLRLKLVAASHTKVASELREQPVGRLPGLARGVIQQHHRLVRWPAAPNP